MSETFTDRSPCLVLAFHHQQGGREVAGLDKNCNQKCRATSFCPTIKPAGELDTLVTAVQPGLALNQPRTISAETACWGRKGDGNWVTVQHWRHVAVI